MSGSATTCCERWCRCSRSTHARVVVGEFVGLFALTENIDGRFTRANFNDGTGNLYKEVWPFTASRTWPVRPSTSTACGPTRETRGSMRPDPIVRRGAVGLGQSCVGRAPVHGRRATDEPTCRRPHHPSRRQPLPLVLRRRHRCRCGNHNFFLRGPDSGIDHHDSVGSRQRLLEHPRRWQPVTIPDGLGDITAGCEVFTSGFGLTQRSASCDPLFAAWASMEDDYLAAGGSTKGRCSNVSTR